MDKYPRHDEYMNDKHLLSILIQMNPRNDENGAKEALQEARKGDFTRLADRYNLPMDELKRKPFEQVITEAWNG